MRAAAKHLGTLKSTDVVSNSNPCTSPDDSAAQREAGQGRFEHVDKCGSPLWAAFGHAMLACSGPANARSQTTHFSC